MDNKLPEGTLVTLNFYVISDELDMTACISLTNLQAVPIEQTQDPALRDRLNNLPFSDQNANWRLMTYAEINDYLSKQSDEEE